MNEETHKLRALFLTALMVLSVFGGAIALSGTAAAANLSEGGTYWMGQQLTYTDSTQNGSTFEVRDTDGTLVSQIQADSSGTVVIDTALTDTGKFVLEGPSGSNINVSFEVVEQSFSASANQNTVENNDGDSIANFSFDSNRAKYDVVVSSSDLSASDLATIFNAPEHDADGDENTDSVIVSGSNANTVAGDFSTASTGNYTLQFDVADSTASSTANVSVTEPTGAAIAFENTVVINQRGDVMEMTLNFQGASDSGRVTIGDTNDVNYEVQFNVTDGDGDGTVTVVWDTGDTHLDNSSNNVSDGISVPSVTVEDSSDMITAAEVVDGVSDPVETGEYPVSVGVDDVAVDLATAIVEERSTTGISLYTAPAATTTNDNKDVSPLLADASGGQQAKTIARGDWVIVEVDASGLGSYVKEKADLKPSGNSSVSLTINETEDSEGRNADPVSIAPSQWQVYEDDGQNDTYYAAFNAGTITGQENGEVGDTIEVTFTVDEDNPVTSESESVSSTFKVIDGESSIDTQAGQVFVASEDGAQVTGDSTWAPGTELTIRLTSEGGETPFVVDNSATVQADGSYAISFDMADKADGQPFSASLSHESLGPQLEDSLPGKIGQLSAAVSMSDQQAQDAGTLVTVDSVTLSQGGFIAIHSQSASGPVIGYSNYLSADSHANVEIRLDEAVGGQTTLVAMTHKDSDSNKQFGFVAQNGEVDGAYTSSGSAVTSSATVTLDSTPTPTPTPTPDDEDTSDGDTDDGDTDDSTSPNSTSTTSPGFGLALALLALAGAALLALRRD